MFILQIIFKWSWENEKNLGLAAHGIQWKMTFIAAKWKCVQCTGSMKETAEEDNSITGLCRGFLLRFLGWPIGEMQWLLMRQVSHFLNWSPPPKPSRPCFYLPTRTGLREWRKWIWSRPTRSCRWLRLTTIDHGNTGNAAGLFFATFFFLDGGACLFFNTAAWNTMETWGGHNTRILQQPHRVDAVEWSRRPLEAKQAPCANGLQSAGRAQIKKGKNRSLLQRHLAAVITFSR